MKRAGVSGHVFEVEANISDEVNVDDRVKDGVVDRVVDVPVLVIIQPPGLHRQKPRVDTLPGPVNCCSAGDVSGLGPYG